MGRMHSKHVCKRTAPEGECAFVDAKVTSIEDLVAVINSGSSLSEAFVELGGSGPKSTGSEKLGLCDGSPIEITGCEEPATVLLPNQSCALNIPLKVSLPPMSSESNLLKLLTFDRSKKRDDATEVSVSIRSDTTDNNNHGSELSGILEREGKKCTIPTEETNGGLENQEWFFTLYDFDDLGKITKEDVLGLFESLYDAVGSVVTPEHQGARTLRLRLTVTPCDKPTCPDVTSSADRTEVLQEQCCPEGSRVRETVSSSIPDGRRRCRAVAPKKLPRSRCHPSSHLHDGSPPHIPRRRPLGNRTVTACGGERRTDDTTTNNNIINNNNNNNNASCKKDVRNSRGVSLARRQSFSEGFRDALRADPESPATGNTGRHQRRQRQRCCSSGASKGLLQLDELHLADLIQHGMDLNDMQQHQHSSKARHHLNVFASKKWNQNSNVNQKPSFCVDCPAEESTQHRNCYLDLAGIENYAASNGCSGRLHSSAQPPNFGVFGDDEPAKPRRKSKSKPSPVTRKHSRCISRRNDGLCTHTIGEEDGTIFAGVSRLDRDARPAKLDLPVIGLETTKPKNNAETVSLAHYHRRHRNRERNQTRAMKQVADWIEKEHVNSRTEKRATVVQQRHEHHHIHEHFHHHIHHHCGNSNT